ncbi:elongation factor Tu GTP binding domain protein [Dictyocaulus viviparus]|uniref:Elongation factor Tu GTP binding domain protein n=1 Tax=Dictyocaulus viviparus TaxID=29172 RepID=A0A0D8XEQ4_DICVI|nr:elongation factor Tu GTP binding domain protein [Dictyocaulus viviparus]
MIDRLRASRNKPIILSRSQICRKSTSDFYALQCSNKHISTDHNCLPPEMELGNIEYKVKLVKPSSTRLQHLITQMKWRLREGQGEAIYEVGVEDGGQMSGLSDVEMEESLITLRAMSDALNASMVIVAVLGGEDVGKSTLCGVMTQGCLDDGNGKARLNLFRFPHEVRSGKTSSVCLDVIGFDSQGKLINYAQHTLEELVERSKKLITLIDLAGDSKYLKTTIHGLSGYKPHFACLLVSAESGPSAATKDHLGLAAALNISVFVIVTKCDLVTKEHLHRVVKSISCLLARAGMTAGIKRIKKKRDAVKAGSELCSIGTVPILCVSSVSGAGLGLLRCFLNVLPPIGTTGSRLQLVTQPTHFTIEETFNVPHVGAVVGGMLWSGSIREGDTVLVGPYKDGSFEKANISSIRRSRQPVQSVLPGEAVSIALDRRFKPLLPLRRGMVLMGASAKPSSCHRFISSLFLLSHSACHLCIGFQATVYIGSVRQTAAVVDMDRPSLQQGKWATVMFELMSGPEHIKPGTPLIFRQGRTKGMGEVIHVVEN